VGLPAVKVSVTGDTMLDVAVGTACVVVLVTRGNAREVDVEDKALDTTLSPETGICVDTLELVLMLVTGPKESVLLELVPLELLELELLEAEVEEEVELAREFVC